MESYLAEIVDPQTGEEVPDGECGELILTTLDRTACPLLRYRTGNWVKKKLHRGRLVLDGGILSRVDDMVVVRGVNVYPSAIEAVVRELPRSSSSWWSSARSMRWMKSSCWSRWMAMWRSRCSNALKPSCATRLLRIPVKLAEPQSLPRHEFKAKRWRLVTTA